METTKNSSNHFYRSWKCLKHGDESQDPGEQGYPEASQLPKAVPDLSEMAANWLCVTFGTLFRLGKQR